ncbi:RHS repeat-associated core domain-containing protein [Pseudomonas putida]|uniref:RHS repeat-associated core domain-containing protein n=1 Tax=Pseudomonas putida TaxID=303 RepID=UPI000C99D312|nr:RHS repeat-associated core domain-containing protein [Pseudomonas putida]QNG09083.1 RHS repeat-associated core domain-containing protein [Pseudomonas putida]HDS1058868.1 RHS repeat-associated core domain-containing protein [Pseudomonas putida]
MSRQRHLLHFYMHTHLHSVLTSAASATFFRDSSVVLAELLCEANQTATTLVGSDMARSPITRSTENTSLPQVYTSYGYEQPPEPTLKLTGFTGQPRSVSAHLYLMGSGRRAYNTALMRFCSPDDLSPFSKGGVNAYAYCNNDPTNYSDQSGRVPVANQIATKSSTLVNKIQPASKTITKTISRHDLEFDFVEELMSRKPSHNTSKVDRAGTGVDTVKNLTTDQIESTFRPEIPQKNAHSDINTSVLTPITPTEVDFLVSYQKTVPEQISITGLDAWVAARILNLRPKASQRHAGLSYDDANKVTLSLNAQLGLLRRTT